MISSLMLELDHHTLPPSLSSHFIKCDSVHPYNTRHAMAGKYLVSKTNTKKYGLNSFQVHGSITLNNLKSLDIYNNAISKKSFLSNLKKSLIDSYQ